MLNKLISGLKALVKSSKANPLAMVVFLILAGMFVVPFLFWAWNTVRAKLPAGVQNVVPIAAAKVTPPGTGTGAAV